MTESLSDKIFMEDIEQKATRDGFGEGLLNLGEENENVVALSADVSNSCRMNFFAEKFPKRFFQIGVAEQNLVGVAAGLAVSGKIPFMATYAVFSPGRTLEQIRTAIAYNDANVKIAGHHSGLLTGFDGATHQALEDIAVMRTIPNMKVVVPADAIEAKKATIFSAQINGPVYLRFAREKTPVFTVEETPFTIGKAEIFWQSLAGGKKPEVLIVGCGPILYNALLAAKELEKEKIGTIVLNNHTIKPLDENKIIELAKKCGAVVSVEEHSVLGGLGGAIAEVLVKNYPAPMEFVGTKDTFGESAAPKDLFKKYGLEPKDIITAVKKVIKRKK
ncbi:transketolase family protein [Candidatus Wolfebacteria bacterium]|nr:transketolase family protein [Candidatus Wolfebacteria bacterium]